MENRITELFKEKNEGILSVYFTAGYPSRDDTMAVLRALQAHGADMVELGIPFSDPIADGPTIQQCNQRALENGMSLQLLFEQLADMRSDIVMPVVLMGSVNSILQYGIEQFVAKCESVGIDGCIFPDLPIEEYEREYRTHFERANLSNIFLISPDTSVERIKRFDEVGSGFLYILSTSATTGKELAISDDMKQRFAFVKELSLRNPALIGFGISNRESFLAASSCANGVIIGTAFLKNLRGSETVEQDTKQFLDEVLGNA